MACLFYCQQHNFFNHGVFDQQFRCIGHEGPGNLSCHRAAEHRGGFSILLKGNLGKGHRLQARKYLPGRRIKSVFQILQIQKKSGRHTHQSLKTKGLAAYIGLAAIAVLAAEGSKYFFNYFDAGSKVAADHPQLRPARSVIANSKEDTTTIKHK